MLFASDVLVLFEYYLMMAACRAVFYHFGYQSRKYDQVKRSLYTLNSPQYRKDDV